MNQKIGLNRCIICGRVVESTFYKLFVENFLVCKECSKGFEIKLTKSKIENLDILILYKYNGFFKDLLYQYKALGDLPLKDCFLTYFKNLITNKYRGYKIILAPSSKNDIEKRGFDHLEEIFKNTNLEILKPFSKKGEWKQSEKSLSERKKIKDHISLNIKNLEKEEKILIVDDVATSFSTLRAMIKELNKFKKFKIKCLVLSKKEK